MTTRLVYSVGCVLFNQNPAKLVLWVEDELIKTPPVSQQPAPMVSVCAMLSTYLQYFEGKGPVAKRELANQCIKWIREYFFKNPLEDIRLEDLARTTSVIMPGTSKKMPAFDQASATKNYIYMVYLHYVRPYEDTDVRLFKGYKDVVITATLHGSLTNNLKEHIKNRFEYADPVDFINGAFSGARDDMTGASVSVVAKAALEAQAFKTFKQDTTLISHVRNEFETPIPVLPPARPGSVDPPQTAEPEKKKVEPAGGTPDPKNCCEEVLDKLNRILEILDNKPVPPKDNCCDKIKGELENIHRALDDLKNKKPDCPPAPGPVPPNPSGGGPPGFGNPPKTGRAPDGSAEEPDKSSSDDDDDGEEGSDTSDNDDRGDGGMCFIDAPTSDHSKAFKAAWEGVIKQHNWEKHLLASRVVTQIQIGAMKTSYADIIEGKHNLPCPAGFTRVLQGVKWGRSAVKVEKRQKVPAAATRRKSSSKAESAKAMAAKLAQEAVDKLDNKRGAGSGSGDESSSEGGS
jgi:hypothetical protein